MCQGGVGGLWRGEPLCQLPKYPLFCSIWEWCIGYTPLRVYSSSVMQLPDKLHLGIRMQEISRKTLTFPIQSQPLSRRKLGLSNNGIHRQAGWAPTQSRSNYSGPFASSLRSFSPFTCEGRCSKFYGFWRSQKRSSITSRVGQKQIYSLEYTKVYSCIIIYYCTTFYMNSKPTFAPPCLYSLLHVEIPSHKKINLIFLSKTTLINFRHCFVPLIFKGTKKCLGALTAELSGNFIIQATSPPPKSICL